MTSIGAMALLAQNPVFGVTITLLSLYERSAGCSAWRSVWPPANPVLIAIVLIVAGLELCSIPYDIYLKGGGLIQFMLGPATVALALPIYANATRIRRAAAGIAAGVAVGATVACASAVGIAWLLGVPGDVLRSIAPKSVTTPIAIGISQEIGGHPSLTAVLVITSGIIGAMPVGPALRLDQVARLGRRANKPPVSPRTGSEPHRCCPVNETAGAPALVFFPSHRPVHGVVLRYAAYLL